MQALSAAIESTGQAKAEAQSRAESSLIEGQAAVDQAKLRAQAAKIEADGELERLTAAREAELAFIKEQVRGTTGLDARLLSSVHYVPDQLENPALKYDFSPMGLGGKVSSAEQASGRVIRKSRRFQTDPES